MWNVAVERQIRVMGPDAERFVDYVVTRDVTRIEPMHARYVILCNEKGGILNDPVLLRPSRDEFWFSLADSDLLYWLQGVNVGLRMDAAIDEIDVCPVQIQGPKSLALMVDLVGGGIRDIPYYGLLEAEIAGCRVVVSQSGFSGEKGYEIYLRDATLHAEALWNAVLEAGKPHQLAVIAPGHQRRIQAGILSWGQDMDHETVPFQCNLAYQVPRRKRGDYIGRAALERMRAEIEAGRPPFKMVLVGMTLGGKPIDDYAPDFWLVSDAGGGDPIGYLTSPWHSPELGGNIAPRLRARRPVGGRHRAERPASRRVRHRAGAPRPRAGVRSPVPAVGEPERPRTGARPRRGHRGLVQRHVGPNLSHRHRSPILTLLALRVQYELTAAAGSAVESDITVEIPDSMRILLDSKAYSQLKRGHPLAADIVRAPEEVLLSPVVIGELLYGFPYRHPERRHGAAGAQPHRQDQADGPVQGAVLLRGKATAFVRQPSRSGLRCGGDGRTARVRQPSGRIAWRSAWAGGGQPIRDAAGEGARELRQNVRGQGEQPIEIGAGQARADAALLGGPAPCGGPGVRPPDDRAVQPVVRPDFLNTHPEVRSELVARQPAAVDLDDQGGRRQARAHIEIALHLPDRPRCGGVEVEAGVGLERPVVAH